MARKTRSGYTWVPGHYRSNGRGKKRSYVDGHWRKKGRKK